MGRSLLRAHQAPAAAADASHVLTRTTAPFGRCGNRGTERLRQCQGQAADRWHCQDLDRPLFFPPYVLGTDPP